MKINKGFIICEIIYFAYIAIFMRFFNYLVFGLPKDRKIILFGTLFIISIVINILIIFLRKEKGDFYKKFFIILLALGLIYTLITPVGTANDEYSHILRTYEITQKYTKFKNNSEFSKAFDVLLNLKNNKAVSYYNYIENYNELNISEEKRDFSNEYNNTKLYSPLQYLPQAIGMSIVDIFTDNIVILGLGARIFGLLFWIIVCTYCVKIIPNKKTFFMMLILLPIHICTASALSGDTVTNAMCLLFIALLYKNVYEKSKLSKKDKILFMISAIMVALCKIVYLPFVLLILLLGKDNFENKKDNIIFKILVIALSCIVGIAWFVIGSLTLSGNNSDSLEQVKFILQNPAKYVYIMMNTYLNSGGNLIFQSTTGYELLCDARVLVYTPVSYILSILIILGLLVRDEDREFSVDKYKKYFVGLIIFGTILLITTAIYVQWTSMFEVGYAHVLGLQGRYFIPIYALFIFIIDKLKLDMKKEDLITANLVLQFIIIFLVMQAYMR